MRTLKFATGEEEVGDGFAVIALVLPLFRGSVDSFRIIQAELLSNTAECLAVLAEVQPAAAYGGDKFRFQLLNFRQPGNATADLVVPCINNATPVSFHFGWDATVRDEQPFLTGESFQLLLEYFTLTICLSNGSILDFLPIVPSCSDLAIAPSHVRCLTFLGTLPSSAVSAETIRFSSPSLVKVSETLSQVGHKWRNHQVKFRSPNLPTPSDPIISYLSPIWDDSTCLASGDAISAVPIEDTLLCIVAAITDSKSELFFAAVSSLSDIDEATETPTNELEFLEPRKHRRSLVCSLPLDFPVSACSCIFLGSCPLLILTSSTDVYCVHLKWVRQADGQFDLHHQLRFRQARSIALISAGTNWAFEVWSDTETDLKRVTLEDNVSGPPPVARDEPPSQKRTEKSRLYNGKLEAALAQLDANGISIFSATANLETLMKTLQVHDKKVLSIIFSMCHKLELDTLLATKGHYPQFLIKRRDYCVAIQERIETRMKNLRLVRKDLEDRIKRVLEKDKEIALALDRLKEKIVTGASGMLYEDVSHCLWALNGGSSGYLSLPSYSQLCVTLKNTLESAPPPPLAVSSSPFEYLQQYLPNTQLAGTGRLFGKHRDALTSARCFVQMEQLAAREEMQGKGVQGERIANACAGRVGCVVEQLSSLDARLQFVRKLELELNSVK
eukprot:Gregarina_sp_Poly_1__10646@NODE_7_length_24424_cov_76_286365_g6_i0_p4_GENE_NODE_7_length_24424_cov_76_286365_g6_i0NODE_7_length_24424_cov_76_286365_g6_i0_p4_ORF_typecomplete_len672_score90_83Nup88/PF10168_9/0_025_NODE_7_length_24424_cov_76_286365_g6_i01124413259